MGHVNISHHDRLGLKIIFDAIFTSLATHARMLDATKPV